MIKKFIALVAFVVLIVPISAVYAAPADADKETPVAEKPENKPAVEYHGPSKTDPKPSATFFITIRW